MAPHRMKAKRSSSFVAKSPFHTRKKIIFPVPVTPIEVDFNPKKENTNFLLEKIGTKARESAREKKSK